MHFTVRNRVPYNKQLINRACSSRTGEYWPSVVAVQTSLRSVRTATASGQYSPIRPSRSVSKRPYLDVGYIVYSLVMMPRSKGGHPPVYWYLTFALLVSLRNTNKYRRWGLIKFELVHFSPFSSAWRSVFSNIFRMRHLTSVINNKSQNPSFSQSTASSPQFYFLIDVRIKFPSSLL